MEAAIARDSDLDEVTSSGTSVRVDPWENGPIVVRRSRHGIVIGHPQDAGAVGSILREVESAVRHVRSYTGRKKWNERVVVVLPTDDDELDRVLENPTTFFEFAAIARPTPSSWKRCTSSVAPVHRPPYRNTTSASRPLAW